MSKKTTWILIADGGSAKVVRDSDSGGDLVGVDGLEFSGPKKQARDIMSDRPGRTHDSVGTGARHAMEYSSDPAKMAQIQFARTIMDKLHAEYQNDAFDSLVVVSPPAFLGLLRDAMSDQIQERVEAEFGKDLTKLSLHELTAHLKKLRER